jgi:hypothetical protein
MRKPEIRITFDAGTKLYAAEETIGEGICGAFGRTPEEAMARLELAKALTSDCELCQEGRRRAGIGMTAGLCYH